MHVYIETLRVIPQIHKILLKKHDVGIWKGTNLGLNLLVLPASLSSRSSISALEAAVASLERRSRPGASDGSEGQRGSSALTVFPFQPSKGSGDSILRFL